MGQRDRGTYAVERYDIPYTRVDSTTSQKYTTQYGVSMLITQGISRLEEFPEESAKPAGPDTCPDQPLQRLLSITCHSMADTIDYRDSHRGVRVELAVSSSPSRSAVKPREEQEQVPVLPPSTCFMVYCRKTPSSILYSAQRTRVSHRLGCAPKGHGIPRPIIVSTDPVDQSTPAP